VHHQKIVFLFPFPFLYCYIFHPRTTANGSWSFRSLLSNILGDERGGMQPRVLLLVRSFSCQDTQDSFFLTDMKRLDYDDIDEDTLPRAPLLLRGIENNCYTFLSSSPHFTICYSRCWFVR